jgi:hypothetical protein
MTAGTISPWPLIRKGDQQHPVRMAGCLASVARLVSMAILVSVAV